MVAKKPKGPVSLFFFLLGSFALLGLVIYIIMYARGVFGFCFV